MISFFLFSKRFGPFHPDCSESMITPVMLPLIYEMEVNRTPMKSSKSNHKIPVATNCFFEASCYDISANVRSLSYQYHDSMQTQTDRQRAVPPKNYIAVVNKELT